MKVDPHLTVVKGQKVPESAHQRNPQPSRQRPREGVVILISQENRRAWRTTPTSLLEARKVLEKVQNRLGDSQEEALAEIHQLDARCLVRLR